MKRRIVTAMAMVLVWGVLAVEAAPGKLVLKGGQTVEIASARVTAGMVYVTLPSGEMRAYTLGDVDLKASGLASKTENEAEAPAKARPQALADFARKNRKATRVTITDADVEHVRPEASGEEPGGKPATSESAKGKLVVAVNRYRRRGNQLSVQGTVTNQGPFPVTGVVLKAEAKDGKGKVVGSAQKDVGGKIDPNGSAGFSIIVDLTSDDVRGVDVHVVGAMAAAAVERPAPQAPPGGSGEETGGEGGE